MVAVTPEGYKLECRRYLSNVKLLENLHRPYAASVAAYVLSSHMALPVKTIIVGERPYSTDIHPLISSAMSYDPTKSRATPSTIGVALDLCYAVGSEYQDVELWFRDSWKYLLSGTVIVNCTLFTPYSASRSINETVPFERWLRSLLECSITMSGSKVDVICMGVPAQNSVDFVLRSMGKERGLVSKKTYPNPASYSKYKQGDARSLRYTFEKKGTSKSILQAVTRSREYPSLSISDYIFIMSGKRPAQLQQVDRVLSSGKAFVDEVEDVYKDMESNHKSPSLREAYEELAKSLVAYRDSVLYDIVSSAISSQGDNSGKIARSTEWGSKNQWKKAPASVGMSSKMSVVSEDIEGVEQKFADDDGTKAMMVDEEPDKGEETPSPPPVKIRKKKMVKRKVTVTRPKPRGTTKEGSKLVEADLKALRTIKYYVSDMDTSASQELSLSIDKSMETSLASTDDIGTVVDTAYHDYVETGKTCDATLGIDTGEVSETAYLPKLLNKLCQYNP